METLNENVLTALSDSMVRAVNRAAMATVLVDARSRMPASGVVYQEDLVLTANHVVEREEQIQIGLPDGSQQTARVAGRDPSSDLCLLRLDKELALPAGILSPQEAQVGQFVLSLGRPTSEGIEASMGVVGSVGGPLRTTKGDMLERFIRTDAIPYPGFSGGPLVDSEGRVLGINTSGFGPGASLAIPVAHAFRVAQSLNEYGRVRRGFLGIRSQTVELTPQLQQRLGRSQPSALLLLGVERGQPADRAGLMVGDILAALDGKRIENHDALLDNLNGERVGRTVMMEILRGGQPVQVQVVIGERR